MAGIASRTPVNFINENSAIIIIIMTMTCSYSYSAASMAYYRVFKLRIATILFRKDLIDFGAEWL